MSKFISQLSLRGEADERIAAGKISFNPEQLVGLASTRIGNGQGDAETNFKMIGAALQFRPDSLPNFEDLKKYGSAFDIPRDSATARKKMSVREMCRAGMFNPRGSTNTLLPDWNSLWDALRVDITVKKGAQAPVRDLLYNVHYMPDSSKIFKVDEFYPYAMNFVLHNGSGQPVEQGETRGGQSDDVEHYIYAAGFSFDLMAELFDRSFDFEKLNNSVLTACYAKQNDLAVAPILAGTYAGAKTTAADTTSGATKEELLYYTLESAIDTFAQKTDPITGQPLTPENLVIIASPRDARRIARVASGKIKKAGVNTDAGFPALSEIETVISFGGESIVGRMKTTSYAGCPAGSAFLTVKNRYANIGVKRNLTLEIDMQPDVKTLAREERAWYFVEGMMYAESINSFTQKITLPNW